MAYPHSLQKCTDVSTLVDRMIDIMCTASYCGCSSSPTSCIPYPFGPCDKFRDGIKQVRSFFLIWRRLLTVSHGGGEMGLTKLDVDGWLIRTVCKSALMYLPW